MPVLSSEFVEKNITKNYFKSGSVSYSVSLNHNRKRYKATFKSLPEAREWLKELKDDLSKNIPRTTRNKIREKSKIKSETVDSNIYTHGDKYRVRFVHDKKKYNIQFDKLDDAIKYRDDKFKELGKKILPISKRGDGSDAYYKSKETVEKYITKIITKKFNKIKYYVSITINEKVYSDKFNNLEDARKYKNKILKTEEEMHRKTKKINFTKPKGPKGRKPKSRKKKKPQKLIDLEKEIKELIRDYRRDKSELTKMWLDTARREYKYILDHWKKGTQPDEPHYQY